MLGLRRRHRWTWEAHYSGESTFPDDDRPSLNRIGANDYWLSRAEAEASLETFLVENLPTGADEGADLEALRLEVEVFVNLWVRASPELSLYPDDARIGEALVQMAAEVVKAEQPPTGVLRCAFDWFARTLKLVADEAATAAGKTLGTTVGVGVGAAATGQLPRLLEALAKVQQALGK